MSDRAAAYQEQVTGKPATHSYVKGPDGRDVKFDAYDTGEFRPWFKGHDALMDRPAGSPAPPTAPR